jgi:hypothetical protein
VPTVGTSEVGKETRNRMSSSLKPKVRYPASDKPFTTSYSPKTIQPAADRSYTPVLDFIFTLLSI